MWIPKPVYEILPFLLIGLGVIFITLVLNRYEYVHVLWFMLLGFLCILAGVITLGVRIIYRLRKASSED
jgi:hypothetical protein